MNSFGEEGTAAQLAWRFARLAYIILVENVMWLALLEDLNVTWCASLHSLLKLSMTCTGSCHQHQSNVSLWRCAEPPSWIGCVAQPNHEGVDASNRTTMLFSNLVSVNLDVTRTGNRLNYLNLS